MEDEEIETRLRSIGKESFEVDFDVYEAYAEDRLTMEEGVEELFKRKRSHTISSARTRLYKARPIFHAGCAKTAFQMATNRQR